MRFLVVNTDYVEFLDSLYRATPGLDRASFAEQQAARERSLFGSDGGYVHGFRALGHEAWSVTANNAPLQLAWAREHGLRVPVGRPSVRRALATARLQRSLRPGAAHPERLLPIVVAQARSYEPDVILVHDMHLLDRETLRALRPLARMLVGQHAAGRLAESTPLEEYDLLISSFEPTVEWFRGRGRRAVLNRLAFDTSVLPAIPEEPLEWELTFVGSLQTVHGSRARFLEELADLRPELRVWTPARPGRGSPLRGRWQGPAYGRDMYRVLRRSFATVNHHGDVPAYANNMRLYEATGIGTLLVTDAKPNLHELFEPGVEVLAFTDARDCAEQLAAVSPERRDAIAAAGRTRTLREHTYDRRLAELVAELEP